MITCYAFGAVPPFAQGLVRDLRVRWALEEAGLPYRVTLVGDRPGEMKREAYNALQPFGQIPADRGRRPAALRVRRDRPLRRRAEPRAPAHPAARPRARDAVDVRGAEHHRAARHAARDPRPVLPRPAVGEGRAAERGRVGAAASGAARDAIKGREYLVGAFSAADILMSHVLKILRHTELLEEQPALVAYRERCEARPAHQKALAGQMEAFAA